MFISLPSFCNALRNPTLLLDIITFTGIGEDNFSPKNKAANSEFK